MNDQLKERIEFFTEICRIMRENNVHEATVGDVRVSVRLPGAALVTSEGGKAHKVIPIPVPSDDELLYWSGSPVDLPNSALEAIGFNAKK